MITMRKTQERLLDTLRREGPLTASRLGERLGIGQTAIRQHLERLRAEGLIEIVGLQRGVGRPGHLYGLTDQADRFFPQQYDTLALDLLDALSEMDQEHDLLRRTLALRRERWLRRFGHRLERETLAERVQALTQVLNEQGSMAASEALPDGTYRLTEHHCPICRVAERYPLLCQEERKWLSQVLQARVDWVESRMAGNARCSFRIVPTSPD